MILEDATIRTSSKQNRVIFIHKKVVHTTFLISIVQTQSTDRNTLTHTHTLTHTKTQEMAKL